MAKEINDNQQEDREQELEKKYDEHLEKEDKERPEGATEGDLEKKYQEFLEKYGDIEQTQKELKQKEKEIFQREVNATLKENGLEKFADVVNVSNQEELDQTVEKLNGIMNEYKVENAYVPTDHAKTDEYDTAKDKGDTQGMLKSLFGFK